MLLAELLLFFSVNCRPLRGACETPVSANAIVDTIGVNVHLHNGNTVYGDFPLIEKLLLDLGVRHTRDGLIDTTWREYYDRHIALGKLGIKCLFITAPSQTSQLLKIWPSRVPGSFEGYEAPNEYDRSGDPDWAETLKAFMRRLYEAIKTDSSTVGFMLVGPSLTEANSYAQMAGSEQYVDFANMHNYYGGRNPGTPGWGNGGYGSITYNIQMARTAWPSKPIMTTETGYITDPALSQGIPEAIAGKYAVRAIFEQTLHGVERTYFYELIDEGAAISKTEAAFGLARLDGTPKPSYTALRNLIATLTDQGPTSLPPNLQFSLLNASHNVHHLLMAKNDGSYYLAFWQEEQSYDVDKHTKLPVTAERLTFVSSQAFKKLKLITFDPTGAAVKTTLPTCGQISLTATDSVSFLVLK